MAKRGRARVDALAAHVDALCAQHGITPEWVGRSKRAWASRKRRAIRIYPVINQKRYVTALHEIGHLVGPRQSGRRIEQEWGAWEFALGCALEELTPATYRMIFRSISSYVNRYRQRRRAYLPPAGDPFWHFLDQLALAGDGRWSLRDSSIFDMRPWQF